jgi:predicted transcriptional regulator
MPEIHIVVDPALKAAVDAQAAAEQRTLKAVVVRALEAYLAEHQERAA